MHPREMMRLRMLGTVRVAAEDSQGLGLWAREVGWAMHVYVACGRAGVTVMSVTSVTSSLRVEEHSNAPSLKDWVQNRTDDLLM